MDLGEQYQADINFVKINIGRQGGRQAGARYGVRATPTFVLFDKDGQILANAAGWPGYQAFVSAFDQILGQG